MCAAVVRAEAIDHPQLNTQRQALGFGPLVLERPHHVCFLPFVAIATACRAMSTLPRLLTKNPEKTEGKVCPVSRNHTS